MRYSLPSTHTVSAYTLVELLIALTLSLLLLIGVIELFGRVSGIMNDTRATLNMSANLDGVELVLRQDLARIPNTLPDKPQRIAYAIAHPGTNEVDDLDGYLEIVEGPDTASSHPYVDENGNPDATVGDVDDILAFAAKTDAAIPFRGLIDEKIAERNAAEVTWFVRGNTLYRRVRLIDDQNTTNDPNVNTIADLARRERRFEHDGPANPFPHPLYKNTNEPWYYLRMPTLEETLHDGWKPSGWRSQPIDLNGLVAKPDLWKQPYFLPNVQDKKSGSLTDYVSDPRHHRAGEDVILTNVLSFDIKVWDPNTKDFVDLGTKGTAWENSSQPDLPRTWDAWTWEYVKEHGNTTGLPPFTEPLKAIQITIRCFDPASQIIKQITVVHQF